MTADIFFFFLVATNHDSEDFSFRLLANEAKDSVDGVEVELAAFASLAAAAAIAASFFLFSASSSLAAATTLAAAAAFEAALAADAAFLAETAAALTFLFEN